VTFVALFLSQVLSWAGVPALGAAALAAAGVLASQGEIALWAVLVVGTAGAQAGALIGWWLGTRVPRPDPAASGRLATRWRTMLTSGERVASRWGGLIVFFVPAAVSGALGMPLRRFAFWNVFAAAALTLGSGLGAYGVGYTLTGHPAAGTVAIVIAAGAAVGVAALFLRRRRRTSAGRA
jgi:MYXO-CTERM domain-containing protein